MFCSRFPGFDNIYALGSKGSSTEFIADIDLGGADPLGVTRGEEPVTGANARWAMGATRPGQVVWTRLISPVLLSDDVVNALQESGVTGWSTYPVDLTGKTGEEWGTYYGLVVTGRCGAIDTSRCSHARKEYPGGTFPILRGLFFDEQAWDGSDVFMPMDQTAWIFVTRLTRDTLAARASNLRFDVLTTVEQFP